MDVEELMWLANQVSANSENRGMAAFTLKFHPYHACWYATISWSDNSDVHSSGQLEECFNVLKVLLRKELDVGD